MERSRANPRDAANLLLLQPESRLWRVVRIALVFLITVGLCALLDLREPFNTEAPLDYFENYVYDVRMAVFGARHRDLQELARRQIVLVKLSDDTFDPENSSHLPGPPVPRGYHARVVQELTRLGAKAIVFDLNFKTSVPHDDALLAEAARRSGRVVWACLFQDENDPQSPQVSPNRRLLAGSPYVGHIHSSLESKRIDRVRPVLMHQQRPVPSLSLAAVLRASGADELPLRRVRGGWQAGDIFVPVDRHGDFNITFMRPRAEGSATNATGGNEVGESHEAETGVAPTSAEQTAEQPKDVFLPFAYENIYYAAVEPDPAMDAFNRPFFEGKIVLIGDTTRIGLDYRNTPSGVMPGVEIHAHAIATILTQQFVREAPPHVNFLVLCLMTALACHVAAAWRLQWVAPRTATWLTTYFVVNVYLFVDHGIWLHAVAPAAAFVLATLGVVTERALHDERQKNWMRGLLGRYVSPQIAEYVISHPEKCVLGGEQVTATVLFSDIRGFTQLTQELQPHQVVGMLNDYLQAMTDVILQHDGTVDKYVGDAIMGLFGIPVPHPDHARRAVAAAIDMEAALFRLHEKWQAEGLPPFDIGIGINTGEMVSGNIGTQQQQNFTVIGEAVNLASRVEGLNKELGTRILITEATYESVRDQVRIGEPRRLSIRGLKQPVTVYEILGWIGHGKARAGE
ncbi:MAG: adenylate/guanylate cyclase domain-containing protein [Armatimonadota bacterium]|nr:adenylate/guanylate cyclase domain-containing protein [Armatimonadota bacterium]